MWQFDDRARSVGLCDETCIPNEDTSDSWNGTNPINVTFFQKEQFGGQSFSVQVEECTQILKWPYLDALSIRIPPEACVLIFLKHSRAARDVSDCSTQDWDNVLEIRDGVPALNDLRRHILNTEFLGYISPCYCKLNPNPNPPPFTYIRLFSWPNFEGNSTQIFLNYSGCKDFAKDAVLEKWEGVAESISVSYGGCVKVFKERNCEDMSGGKELITPFATLDDVELFAEIRSLKLCRAEHNPEEERIPISDTKIPNTRVWIYLLTIGGISILTGTSLVIAALYLQRRTKQIKKATSKLLSNTEINEFLYGHPLDCKDEENKNIRNFIDQESQTDSLQFSYESHVNNKPYDYQLEIKRDQLHFDNKHPIGSGQFGLVYKGVMTVEDTAVDVAIKTSKPLSGAESLRTLMREVKVMMYAGHHPTIVNLMGCCTANLQEGYLFIVMEYCNNGSLGNYLMTNQHNFVNSLKTETIFSSVTFVKNDHITTDYVKQLTFPQSSPCNLEEINRFDSHQLIVWSRNIADGMDYLANKKVS
ncbi:Mast/stem cell growth factor receptor kita [Orchesella cincta]|uniref:Mast/stem cell growth factor receptor kita n=1 Tax=Orchesella cincta TaxID=48709 RepID=A0A1D2M2I0_ORCCI|nr:Mast/stem cell growth factor receptor kita [Orchesella cincta]